ncbi:MAG: XTP/dITP diphosphatase [Candidatus Altiarchaeota archaeon]
MKVVNFATSNKFKVDEANSVGKNFGIRFVQLEVGYPEIRDENVENVAKAGAKFVFEKIKKPVVVEDTGLYIKALNGFPGSYSKFVFQKIGNKGILRLLEGEKDRSAEFISSVGYFDGKNLRTFTGISNGKILEEEKGIAGFGYDPIFLPEGQEKTFAQDYSLKKKISHRKIAFEKFCKWFSKEFLLR